MNNPNLIRCLILFSASILPFFSFSQELYTARGYWEESTKSNYLSIKKRQVVGDSLNANEQLYLSDYESYLFTYYGRLSEHEKVKYAQMKDNWDRGLTEMILQKDNTGNKFEVKKTNWLANGFYGLYYGISAVVIADVHGAAAGGIPLITSGLWMLGPVIRPHKYEQASFIRASNTGRMLGLGYGAALGWAIDGNRKGTGNLVLGLSSIGSIALGEIGFYLQEKKNFSLGRIDLIRHYNFLGAWTALAAVAATETNNSHLGGASLLVGGISGFFIGNKLAKKYDYTRGDVDAISSLTLITTGFGLTAVVENLPNNNNSNALILIPAASSIAGTLISQRQIRGAHLSDRQGTIINWALVGSALVGVGGVAISESDSPAAYIGVPSALALITHQLLLHKFKMKNIETQFQGSVKKKQGIGFAFKAMPENYFLNKLLSSSCSTSSFQQSSLRTQNPLATLRITF
jgi:hypothetical protein